MILYTHKSLEAREVNMINKFNENIFVKIRLNEKDNFLVGLFYRSESGTGENNEIMR